MFVEKFRRQLRSSEDDTQTPRLIKVNWRFIFWFVIATSVTLYCSGRYKIVRIENEVQKKTNND